MYWKWRDVDVKIISVKESDCRTVRCVEVLGRFSCAARVSLACTRGRRWVVR